MHGVIMRIGEFGGCKVFDKEVKIFCKSRISTLLGIPKSSPGCYFQSNDRRSSNR